MTMHNEPQGVILTPIEAGVTDVAPPAEAVTEGLGHAADVAAVETARDVAALRAESDTEWRNSLVTRLDSHGTEMAQLRSETAASIAALQATIAAQTAAAETVATDAATTEPPQLEVVRAPVADENPADRKEKRPARNSRLFSRRR